MKNAGVRKSRMSLTANLDERIDELMETPLPLPPPEMDLCTAFDHMSCTDELCKTVIASQNDNTKKLQGLC